MLLQQPSHGPHHFKPHSLERQGPTPLTSTQTLLSSLSNGAHPATLAAPHQSDRGHSSLCAPTSTLFQVTMLTTRLSTHTLYWAVSNPHAARTCACNSTHPPCFFYCVIRVNQYNLVEYNTNILQCTKTTVNVVF